MGWMRPCRPLGETMPVTECGRLLGDISWECVVARVRTSVPPQLARVGNGVEQPMETIKAGEKALKDVFCDHYVFRIPPYQRPYSWETEQAGDLLDDLIWAAGHDKPAERPPYFLGSIVVIKDPNYPEADVVDGQQRLTTLTILMSVLREL